MPIVTSLEEIARRQHDLSDKMAEERRKEGHDGVTSDYLDDILELRRELVLSTECVASDLIKYCRRLANDPKKTGVGYAVQILVDVAERNWNTTREGSLAEIVNALAGSFGVDQVRETLDTVEKKRAEPKLPWPLEGRVPPWGVKPGE